MIRPVVDLSPSMAIRVRAWERVHKVDTELLFGCGYYPRGGCQDCSWNQPNLSCKFSHILSDTRLSTPYTPNQQAPSTQIQIQTKKKRDKTAWGVNLESILSKLPPAIQEEFKRILNQYKED